MSIAANQLFYKAPEGLNINCFRFSKVLPFLYIKLSDETIVKRPTVNLNDGRYRFPDKEAVPILYLRAKESSNAK